MEALLGAGFDPDETATFVLEGLMMYLPPGEAPGRLLRSIASLMCNSGSLLVADVYKRSLPLGQGQFDIFAKYGTTISWDVQTRPELISLIADGWLRTTALVTTDEAHATQVPAHLARLSKGGAPLQRWTEGELADLRAAADGILRATDAWTSRSIDVAWVRSELAKGISGVEWVARALVVDGHGLQAPFKGSAPQIDKLIELVLGPEPNGRSLVERMERGVIGRVELASELATEFLLFTAVRENAVAETRGRFGSRQPLHDYCGYRTEL